MFALTKIKLKKDKQKPELSRQRKTCSEFNNFQVLFLHNQKLQGTLRTGHQVRLLKKRGQSFQLLFTKCKFCQNVHVIFKITPNIMSID